MPTCFCLRARPATALPCVAARQLGLFLLVVLASAPFLAAQEPRATSEQLQQALTTLIADGDSASIARAYQRLAETLQSEGSTQAAIETWRRAIVFAGGAADSTTLAAAHHGIGLRHWSATRYDSALVHLTQARRLREATGDRAGLGRVLNTIGATHYQEGEYELALDAFLNSLVIRREAGDLRGVAIVLTNIGKVYHDWRQFDRALPTLEEAVAVARGVDDPAATGYALNSLGVLQVDREDFEAARHHLNESLALYQAGHPRLSAADSASGWSLAMLGLGLLHIREGNPVGALEPLGAVHAIAKRNNSLRGQARTNLHLGQAYRAMGERPRAVEAFTRSLEFARQGTQRTTSLEALAALASLEEERGNAALALGYLRAHHALRDSVFAQSAAQQVLAMEARMAVEQQQRDNLRLLEEGRAQSIIIARQRGVVLLGGAVLALSVVLMIVLVRFNRLGKERAALLSHANADLHAANHELRTAISEVRTLKGLIPICANCKKVRDDRGYWESVESYVTSRSEALFTHGICATCGPSLYGEMWEAEPAPDVPAGEPRQ
ncbi:MAG TPA: tetratricopeptide repeat protein [Gemmatimonadales bacterium]|nr:tetratricopeptide repeat protein [Gemmatimonadales bacterium]